MVDGSCELLRLEEALRPERPRLLSALDAIRAFCDIEDDSVRVKLRSGVAIDGPGCVVLEFCDDELAGGFGGPVAAEPRLRVPLKLTESSSDRHAVCLADPAVAANKGGQRNRLRCAEGRIPSPANRIVEDGSKPAVPSIALKMLRIRSSEVIDPIQRLRFV